MLHPFDSPVSLWWGQWAVALGFCISTSLWDGLWDTACPCPYNRVCRLLWQPCQKIKGEEKRQNLTLLRQKQGVKHRGNIPEILKSECVFTANLIELGLGWFCRQSWGGDVSFVGVYKEGKEVLATATLFNEEVMQGEKKKAFPFFPFALL